MGVRKLKNNSIPVRASKEFKDLLSEMKQEFKVSNGLDLSETELTKHIAFNYRKRRKGGGLDRLF